MSSFASACPSRVSVSVGSRAALFVLFLIFLIPSGEARRGCQYFGHSCYGGHGKRAMLEPWNAEGTPVVKPIFAPRLWQTSKERLDLRPNVLLNEWLNSRRADQFDFQSNNEMPSDDMKGGWTPNEDAASLGDLKLTWPDASRIEKKQQK